MKETIIVVMEKDNATGFLTNELFTFELAAHESLLVNIFAYAGESGRRLRMKVSTGADVEDRHFDAIYDHYDPAVFADMGVEIAEEEDVHNPTWVVDCPCPADPDAAGERVGALLDIHAKELAAVMRAIADEA